MIGMLNLNLFKLGPDFSLSSKRHGQHAAGRGIQFLGGPTRGVRHFQPSRAHRRPHPADSSRDHPGGGDHDCERLIWFEAARAFNYDWQDWRINVLGSVPGPMMDLLNAAEEKFWTRSDKWECSDMVLAACFLQKTLILQVSDTLFAPRVTFALMYL